MALSAGNGFMRWPTSSRSSPESLAVCSAFSRSQACYMAVEMEVLFSICHVVLSFSSLVSCCFYEDSAKIRFSEEHCNSRRLYLTSFIKTSHAMRKGMRWLPSCWAVSRLFALSGGGSAVCSRLVAWRLQRLLCGMVGANRRWGCAMWVTFVGKVHGFAR